MGILSALGDTINAQFGVGENTTSSLGADNMSYGALGDYANKIDQSAERNYIEDGFIRDIRPRSRALLYQQPDTFVVIKKRMFSSLNENARTDLLEEKERLLLIATKRLFQNKCRVIAAYERLTKIEEFTTDSGRFNTFVSPYLFDLVSATNALTSGVGNLFGVDGGIPGSAMAAIETLRKVSSYSAPGEITNWVTNDLDSVFANHVGEGTGTFELTNIASVNTKVSNKWGGGSADLTIEDPYNLMTITEKDIDQAISDAVNPMRTGAAFRFTQIELQNRIDTLKGELAVMRRSRQASNITFMDSPGTLISKRVRAVLDDEGVEVKFEYSTGVQDGLSGLESASDFGDVASSVGDFFSTGSVQIDPRFIQGNEGFEISEGNQMTPSEAEKFAEIISNAFTLMAQYATSRQELKKEYRETNYVRNRMRLFFNGKFIIQPMDSVSIFMNSRTGEDGKLPGGYGAQETSANSVGQKFDTLLRNIDSALDDLKDPWGTSSKMSTFDDIERVTTVGPHVPKWLWQKFRQDITAQPTGPCVFSGIVGGGGVKGQWSEGKWTVGVQCKDNTDFFEKSEVNFKPSADVFNAAIYDPLTPFDVSFDAATGVPITEITEGDFPPLLPENKEMLLSGAMVFDSGPRKGEVVTEEGFFGGEELAFGKYNRVLHDPGGLMYRWKQGIQSITQTSRPNPETTIEQERAVRLTNSAFAGQDVMNVISLLVTAQPYNYGTFLKSAINNGNNIGSKDSLTGNIAAETYIQGLLSDISKNNQIWGNFIPFKKVVQNSELDRTIAESRLDSISANSKLSQKINERARAQDEMVLKNGGVDPSVEGGSPDAGDSALMTKISNLNVEIEELQKGVAESMTKPDGGLVGVGSDVSDYTTVDDAASNESQRRQDSLELRRNLGKYTSRKYWKVKANEDQNLFIVDDQYDKNLDIQAFERGLSSGISIFESKYQGLGKQISDAAKLLGLEVFANSQGHIVVQPPGYNKVPSSVFNRMFKDRDTKGVKVFPEFLESLFFNQIRGIFNSIEVIEDQIRLRVVAVGRKYEQSENGDEDIVKFLKGEESNFAFLTDPKSGMINNGQFQTLFSQSNPEFGESLESGSLDPTVREEASRGVSGEENRNSLGKLSEYSNNVISKQLKINSLFTVSIQADATKVTPNFNIENQADSISKIRERLLIKTGREAPNIGKLLGNDKFKRLETTAVSSVDRVRIVNQIGRYLSERQTLIRSLSKAIQDLQNGVDANTPPEANESIFGDGLSGVKSAWDNVTTPGLQSSPDVPSIIEHMIEHEQDHELGFNSGRRFVITPDRITSLSIQETEPEYTMTSVKGLFGEGFVEPPSSLNLDNGGNAVTTAYAVDYDMWQMYGLRVSPIIEAPFLSDPDSQCAPFAVSNLTRVRENIFRGSVTVKGYNEFYQVGDVVYIEDRGLLFYVEEVSHSSSYKDLSTTLSLTYGHNPGEYIPTMLDTVGKILYNAKGFSGQYRNQRQQMSGSSRPIGALVFSKPINSESEDLVRVEEGDDPMTMLLSGQYGERNKNVLTNTILSTSGIMNQVNFRTRKARVNIVIYKSNDSFYSEMESIALAVKDWMVNPEQNTPDGGLIPMPTNLDGSAKPNGFGINSEDIIIEAVDFGDPDKQTRERIFPESENAEPVKNLQGPSRAAITVTKALGGADLKSTFIKTLLANSVIDIFVTYEKVKETQSASEGGSEGEQEDTAAVEEAKNYRGTYNENNPSGDPLTDNLG